MIHDFMKRTTPMHSHSFWHDPGCGGIRRLFTPAHPPTQAISAKTGTGQSSGEAPTPSEPQLLEGALPPTTQRSRSEPHKVAKGPQPPSRLEKGATVSSGTRAKQVRPLRYGPKRLAASLKVKVQVSSTAAPTHGSVTPTTSLPESPPKVPRVQKGL